MSNPEARPDLVCVSANDLTHDLVRMLNRETGQRMTPLVQQHWHEAFREAILNRAAGSVQ